MCIDIVEIWFGFVNGQISSISDRVVCQPHDSSRVLPFHVFIFVIFFSRRQNSAHPCINSPLNFQSQLQQMTILTIFFYLLKKASPDILCELSTKQSIHMKYQDLFSLKIEKKKSRLSSTTNFACHFMG